MSLNDESRALAERLHEIVSEMVGRDLRSGETSTALDRFPFDIEPANYHTSKLEFQEELTFIKNWLAQMELLSGFLEREQGGAVSELDLSDLSEFVNAWALDNANYSHPETAVELAVNNVMKVGAVPSLLLLNSSMRAILEKRLEALEHQEKEYWSVGHRPPKYYARTIALRLAKLYARELKKAPTMGTSGETGGPSTRFARALQATFGELSIFADFRAAGVWAISQLSERDFRVDGPAASLDVIMQIAQLGYLDSPNDKPLSDD